MPRPAFIQLIAPGSILCAEPRLSRCITAPAKRYVTVARPMCGCGRTSWLSPGRVTSGPKWSKNTNGPTALPRRRRQQAADHEPATQVLVVRGQQGDHRHHRSFGALAPARASRICSATRASASGSPSSALWPTPDSSMFSPNRRAGTKSAARPSSRATTTAKPSAAAAHRRPGAEVVQARRCPGASATARPPGTSTRGRCPRAACRW